MINFIIDFYLFYIIFKYKINNSYNKKNGKITDKIFI